MFKDNLEHDSKEFDNENEWINYVSDFDMEIVEKTINRKYSSNVIQKNLKSKPLKFHPDRQEQSNLSIDSYLEV